MRCSKAHPLHFARHWMEEVAAEAHDDIAVRFLGLARRVREKLDGSFPKACAGACLMVAVKVEEGMCPPLESLCSTLGVSPRAVIKWEARALELLDWNLQLTKTRDGEGALAEGEVAVRYATASPTPKETKEAEPSPQ